MKKYNYYILLLLIITIITFVIVYKNEFYTNEKSITKKEILKEQTITWIIQQNYNLKPTNSLNKEKEELELKEKKEIDEKEDLELKNKLIDLFKDVKMSDNLKKEFDDLNYFWIWNYEKGNFTFMSKYINDKWTKNFFIELFKKWLPKDKNIRDFLTELWMIWDKDENYIIIPFEWEAIIFFKNKSTTYKIIASSDSLCELKKSDDCINTHDSNYLAFLLSDYPEKTKNDFKIYDKIKKKLIYEWDFVSEQTKCDMDCYYPESNRIITTNSWFIIKEWIFNPTDGEIFYNKENSVYKMSDKKILLENWKIMFNPKYIWSTNFWWSTHFYQNIYWWDLCDYKIEAKKVVIDNCYKDIVIWWAWAFWYTSVIEKWTVIDLYFNLLKLKSEDDLELAYNLKYSPEYSLEKFKEIYSETKNIEIISQENIANNKYKVLVKIDDETYESIFEIIDMKLKTVSSKKID